MPAEIELTMRRLRQLLRLHHEGISAREIVRTLGAARSTIQDALNRAKSAGFGWPLPSDLTDEILERRLFAPSGRKATIRRLSEPDWASVSRELKRPGVNCFGRSIEKSNLTVTFIRVMLRPNLCCGCRGEPGIPLISLAQSAR
jgi:DNA-binding transcriptional regulator LsrR (DeoR family)